MHSSLIYPSVIFFASSFTSLQNWSNPEIILFLIAYKLYWLISCSRLKMFLTIIGSFCFKDSYQETTFNNEASRSSFDTFLNKSELSWKCLRCSAALSIWSLYTATKSSSFDYMVNWAILPCLLVSSLYLLLTILIMGWLFLTWLSSFSRRS